MKAIFNSPCILFAIPKSVSLIIGGRSTSGFSANNRFSGFKSYKIRGKQFDLELEALKQVPGLRLVKKTAMANCVFVAEELKKRKQRV